MSPAVASALEDDFRRALLDPAAPLPAGLGTSAGAPPVRRFAVYRNNVVLGLAGALASRFPAARAIVGEDFFRAMAAAFVRVSPPRSPVLLSYGDDLPAFVEAFEPAREVPYLADVIRLEIAVSESYHAADAVPASAEALAALDPAQLDVTVARLHPAVRLVGSIHPIVTLWRMNSGGMDPAPIEPWAGEVALVSRPLLDVCVQSLPPGSFAFLSALAAGRSLADGLQAALDAADASDPAAALAGLIAGGLVTAFTEETVP